MTRTSPTAARACPVLGLRARPQAPVTAVRGWEGSCLSLLDTQTRGLHWPGSHLGKLGSWVTWHFPGVQQRAKTGTHHFSSRRRKASQRLSGPCKLKTLKV